MAVRFLNLPESIIPKSVKNGKSVKPKLKHSLINGKVSDIISRGRHGKSALEVGVVLVGTTP